MLLWVVCAKAQPATVIVEAKMDSSVLWMGEQTAIHLSLTQDEGQQVIFPQIVAPGELTKGVEVLELSEPDTTRLQNNRLLIEQKMLVTSFDSGFYYIPPFKYLLNEDTIATESLSLKIVPVDIAPEATVADMRDIKDVVNPPFVLWDFMPTWAWVLIVVLAVLGVIAFLLVKFFKNRKTEEPLTPQQRMSPYEYAMLQLKELRESKLWQQGQEKQYYTRLVDILREYIDSRFGISAMEMTSAQIVEAMRQNKSYIEENKYLGEVLSMADFVKFAKMRPMPEDNERMMRRAVDFVELTCPKPEPSEETPEVAPEK